MNDLISRAAAKKEIISAWTIWEDANFIARRIDLIPSVDAKSVKHGRWIDINPSVSLDPRMRCSICGSVEHPLIKWRYCPICGAVMDMEEER